MPRVVNVDILNDREPIILVQHYVFDDRTLLVFRKPSGEEGEQFALSRGVEYDPALNWNVLTILDDAPPQTDDLDELDESEFEVFALIYRAEDNPPWRAGESRPDADPYALIVYNPRTEMYYCQPALQGYDELERIAEPSFKATLYFAVDALHDALARHGE